MYYIKYIFCTTKDWKNTELASKYKMFKSSGKYSL